MARRNGACPQGSQHIHRQLQPNLHPEIHLAAFHITYYDDPKTPPINWGEDSKCGPYFCEHAKLSMTDN